MPDSSISDLTLATALAGTERFPAIEPDGADWANIQIPVGLLMPHPGYVAGRWYATIPGVVAAGAALVVNSIRLHPFVLTQPITVSDLGCRITTLSAGGNIQLAIYGSDTTTRHPTGNALASTGSISTAATGGVSADITGSNVLIPPGFYWQAVNSDNAVVVIQVLSSGTLHAGHSVGSATMANMMVGPFNLNIAQTFGTWPDLTAGGFSEGTGSSYAMLFLKAA